jgi:hypothetical protein
MFAMQKSNGWRCLRIEVLNKKKIEFSYCIFLQFLYLFAFNSTSAAVTVRTAIQRLRKTAKTIVE